MYEPGRYEWRPQFKDEFELVGEEQDVQQALREYHVDDLAVNVFCPIEALYTEYRKMVDRRPEQPPGRTILTKQYFGAALRRVFDLDEADKGQRRVGGKRVWGYYCLVGPASVKLPDARGRRPNDHDYFVETE